MSYNIIYNGKTYQLANKTIEVAKRLQGFIELQKVKNVKPEEIENLVNDQFNFACEVLGRENVNAIFGEDIHQIEDIDELLELCYLIVEGYESKAQKKREERIQKEISGIINNSTLNKALDVASKINNIQ